MGRGWGGQADGMDCQSLRGALMSPGLVNVADPGRR